MEQQHVYNIYNKIATHFDHTRFSHWKCIANFLNDLPKHSVVADIGTGNGKYLTYRDDITMIGNDTCDELLQIVTNRNKHTNVLQANGLNLPYKDCAFDAVISVAVMHHLSTSSSRAQFLQEAIRILRPGGRCIVTVWAREQPMKSTWEPINDTNDFFVPWTHKDEHKMYKRYYHMFTRHEVEELVAAQTDRIRQYAINYELGNWCLEIELA
jgi:SAM-dependent methyltransferase